MWRRRLLIALLLFSFCVCSFTAQSAQENLTKLEDTLIQLEMNSLDQKNIIENLQKDLEASQLTCINLENLRIEMSAELDNALKSLKKQELLCRNWKTFAMVAIPLTAITATGITYMVLNNK